MPTETDNVPQWLIEHLKCYRSTLEKMKDDDWQILPFAKSVTDPEPANQFLGRQWTQHEIQMEIINIDLWLLEQEIQYAN